MWLLFISSEGMLPDLALTFDDKLLTISFGRNRDGQNRNLYGWFKIERRPLSLKTSSGGLGHVEVCNEGRLNGAPNLEIGLPESGYWRQSAYAAKRL